MPAAEELTPPQAAHWAARTGLLLPDDRHEAVAATANHIHSVVAVLRELDFADTPPTPFPAEEEPYAGEEPYAEEKPYAEEEPHRAAV
ncbi:hypothetical protein [Streptomyces sp. NPDC058308]|uniref:hypothetical protein n=1 Tax=Streptomyces sp. NPDC058308 TaxID=3346440 RepID=UPI0036E06962